MIATGTPITPAPAEIAVGVVIGRTAEFFDFFVFAIASVLVFPRIMFPFAEPLPALLWSFLLFALFFVARPFGTVHLPLDRPALRPRW